MHITKTEVLKALARHDCGWFDCADARKCGYPNPRMLFNKTVQFVGYPAVFLLSVGEMTGAFLAGF